MATQPANPAPRRKGHYVDIGCFHSTDNTADFKRWQLYLHDERAPLGWEKRGLNG